MKVLQLEAWRSLILNSYKYRDSIYSYTYIQPIHSSLVFPILFVLFDHNLDVFPTSVCTFNCTIFCCEMDIGGLHKPSLGIVWEFWHSGVLVFEYNKTDLEFGIRQSWVRLQLCHLLSLWWPLWLQFSEGPEPMWAYRYLREAPFAAEKGTGKPAMCFYKCHGYSNSGHLSPSAPCFMLCGRKMSFLLFHIMYLYLGKPLASTRPNSPPFL